MSKFDTSWFDIDNYKQLSDMDLMSWFRVLKTRYLVLHAMDNNWELDMSSFIYAIKKFPLITNNSDYPSLLPDYFSSNSNYDDQRDFIKSVLSSSLSSRLLEESGLQNFKSVTSLNTFAIAQTYEISKLSGIWRACNAFLEGNASEEESLIAVRPLDLTMKLNEMESSFAHVLVDTESTDEQILKDFKDWLTRYRLESQINVPKKNFTLDKMKQWNNAGVIPYLDLISVAKFEKRSITQAKLGNLIFPNDYDTCLTERIRKVTKPMATSLMNEGVINAFQEQMIVECIKHQSGDRNK